MLLFMFMLLFMNGEKNQLLEKLEPLYLVIEFMLRIELIVQKEVITVKRLLAILTMNHMLQKLDTLLDLVTMEKLLAMVGIEKLLEVENIPHMLEILAIDLNNLGVLIIITQILKMGIEGMLVLIIMGIM